MKSFVTYPVLGLNTNVPITDMSLLKMIGENSAQTYCVDGRNIDFARTRNSCSKSVGRGLWSNGTVVTPSYCLGIFELYDGTNRVVWMVYDGNVYRYDSARDPQEVADAGATAFASGVADFYSFIRYGSYMVFADRAEHTPYCSDYNDANLLKLISGGTEFKFRYLESFARRIIGAYSDQSNGNIDIRWTNANPTPNSDCVFAAANQLFVPNDDPITGIKKMGNNACYVYCEDSINRLDYYSNYSAPFGFTTIIDGQGATNHHSIINENNINYFYNKNYGFCAYDGGSQVIPISREIENWVRDIKLSITPHIIGASLPYKNQLVWTVPLEGSSTPNALLLYDYVENKWSRRDIVVHYVSPFIAATDVTWTKLVTELGYTTWESLGNQRWTDLINEQPSLAVSATDGKLYSLSTESDNTSAMDGYRVEPAISFGKGNFSILLEIWFSIVSGGDYDLYVYYRSGNSNNEISAANWITVEEVSLDNPRNAVCRLESVVQKSARFHQIKWGTDAANEMFSINQIEYVYQSESRW